MTLKEEDEIAQMLSGLTPLEYSSLMRKVNRNHWDTIPSPSKSKFSLFSNNELSKIELRKNYYEILNRSKR